MECWPSLDWLRRLQWGRARAGAEILNTTHVQKKKTRFNGAAPARARKFSTVESHIPSSSELQWGRARAEIRDHARPAHAIPRASMGPRPRGRGNGWESNPYAVTTFRFNGAAPARARKSRERGVRGGAERGFNGAAPARARK